MAAQIPATSRLTGRLTEPGAGQPHDRLVERREEAGAVARGERLWAAGDFAGAAQRIHQIAGCQREPDRVLGERPPVRRDHFRACFHAAARQRHVGGDDDIAGARAFGDPVVRFVHAGADHHALDHLIARHRDRAVADDKDLEINALERMPLGDAIQLLLHRAGIGVDVEGDVFG